MLALVAFIIAVCLLVTIHEAGHFYTARYFGVKVDRFSVGMGKIWFSRKGPSGTEYALSVLPLGGYVKFDEPSYNAQTPLKLMAIIAAGPVVNLLFAWFAYSALWMGSTANHLLSTAPLLEHIAIEEKFLVPAKHLSKILAIREGPAAKTELNVGDEIVSIDGQQFSTTREMINYIKNQKKSVLLAWKHEGALREASIPLAFRQGPEGQAAFLGIEIAPIPLEIAPGSKSLSSALYLGAQQVWSDLRLIGSMLGSIFQQESKALEHLGGPVSIAKGAGGALEAGFLVYLHFLALISVSLGVMNALPIPGLDGGHFILKFVHLCTGKALPKKVELMALKAGYMLLLLIFSIAIFNDLK